MLDPMNFRNLSWYHVNNFFKAMSNLAPLHLLSLADRPAASANWKILKNDQYSGQLIPHLYSTWADPFLHGLVPQMLPLAEPNNDDYPQQLLRGVVHGRLKVWFCRSDHLIILAKQNLTFHHLAWGSTRMCEVINPANPWTDGWFAFPAWIMHDRDRGPPSFRHNHRAIPVIHFLGFAKIWLQSW